MQSYYYNSFIKAVLRGNLKQARHLVETHDLNVCYDSCAALYIAIQNRHLKLLQFLLKRRGKIDKSFLSRHLSHFVSANSFYNEDLEMVRFLLNENLLNLHHSQDRLFRLAAQFGQLDMVKFLVFRGADLSGKDFAATRHSVLNGDVKMFKFLRQVLIKDNFNKYFNNRYFYFDEALQSESLEMIKYVCENHHIDVNNTFLPLKFLSRRPNILKYLVSQGLDVSKIDLVEIFKWGYSLNKYVDRRELQNVIETGDKSLIKNFLKKLRAEKEDYEWAFIFAVWYGDLDVIKFLEEEGADVRTWKDYAMSLSVKAGHLNVVKYLILKGLSLGPHGYDGGLSILEVSAQSGHMHVFKYLKSILPNDKMDVSVIFK